MNNTYYYIIYTLYDIVVGLDNERWTLVELAN
jgi:hypothetical protein